MEIVEEEDSGHRDDCAVITDRAEGVLVVIVSGAARLELAVGEAAL